MFRGGLCKNVFKGGSTSRKYLKFEIPKTNYNLLLLNGIGMGLGCSKILLRQDTLQGNVSQTHKFIN